jgi:tRNA pseudouridine55 synthase
MRFDLVRFAPPGIEFAAHVGSGTYIRSLAHDLGARLGPGAYLAALVRTRSGPFSLPESITLEALEAALADGSWRDRLYAADTALLDRRAAILGPESEARLRNGQVLRFPDAIPPDGRTMPPDDVPPDDESPSGELLRAYSTDGRFLGLLRFDAAQMAWQPHKVLQIPSVEDMARD